MDPLTHALLGASAAGARSKNRDKLRVALVCGALAGMFPDIDVVIRSADNPMLQLHYHRHFTHSLLFVPVGALIVAWLIQKLIFTKETLRQLWVFCALGMVCHGLLDASTNFGTHLFWPFTDRRESWSLISIIDPLFTVPLLVAVVLAAVRKQRKVLAVVLCYCALYLTWGYYQREAATAQMQALATTRGQSVERYEVKPSFANQLLWRTQYLHKGTIYTDAVNVAPWLAPRVYEGSAAPLYTLSDALAARLNDDQKRELDFFTFFSDGWVVGLNDEGTLVGDARFAMLPEQLKPLWAIRLLPDEPVLKAQFERFPRRVEGDTQQLWNMIRGRDAQEAWGLHNKTLFNLCLSA
jgi:inner membrane protein